MVFVPVKSCASSHAVFHPLLGFYDRQLQHSDGEDQHAVRQRNRAAVEDAMVPQLSVRRRHLPPVPHLFTGIFMLGTLADCKQVAGRKCGFWCSALDGKRQSAGAKL
jgi:hypothetical protein